jgi:hypothetical protein
MTRNLSSGEKQAVRDKAVLTKRRKGGLNVLGNMAFRVAVDFGKLAIRGEKPFADQKNIYVGSKTLATYCVDKNINDVIFIDKSARPLWVGFATYWKLAYADQLRPSMFFFNPNMYRAPVENARSSDVLAEELLKAGQNYEQQLQAIESPLLARKNVPLLLVDACIHSGKSLYLARRVFESAGFQSIYTGTLSGTLSRRSSFAPDVCGANNALAAHCFRARPDSSLVSNREASALSAAVRQSGIQQSGIVQRESIRTIVQEFFAVELLEQ